MFWGIYYGTLWIRQPFARHGQSNSPGFTTFRCSCRVWRVGCGAAAVECGKGTSIGDEMSFPYQVVYGFTADPRTEQKTWAFSLVLYHRNHKHLQFETFEVRM